MSTTFYANQLLDADFENALKRFIYITVESETSADTHADHVSLIDNVAHVLGLNNSEKELIWMVGSQAAFEKVTLIDESATVTALKSSSTDANDIREKHTSMNQNYTNDNITAFKGLFNISTAGSGIGTGVPNLQNFTTNAVIFTIPAANQTSKAIQTLEAIQTHLEDEMIKLFDSSTDRTIVFDSENVDLQSSFIRLASRITNNNLVDLLKKRPLYAFAALYPMTKSASMNKKLFSMFLYVYFIHQMAKALNVQQDNNTATLMETIHERLFKTLSGFHDFYKLTAQKDRDTIALSEEIHTDINAYQEARATFRAHVENERYMQAELKKEQNRNTFYVVVSLVLMCIVIVLSAIATLAKSALPDFIKNQMLNIYAAVLFLCFLWVLVSAILLAIKK